MASSSHARSASFKPRKRHRRPDRRMGVLAAILPHTRHVSADVARIDAQVVERRIQKLNEPVLALDQAFVDGVHRRYASARVRRRRIAPTSFVRWNRSGIRRSAPSRAACRRRSRRGDTSRHPNRAAPGCDAIARTRCWHRSRKRRVALAVGKGAELRQHLEQEESQPDAFALALRADVVHAVVPVAGPDQRQAVLRRRRVPALSARTQCW